MAAVPELHQLQSRYLHLDELFIDDLIWVDSVDGLQAATSYVEGCKVVGVDCEWKPNYVKGSKPNKVLHHLISKEDTDPFSLHLSPFVSSNDQVLCG